MIDQIPYHDTRSVWGCEVQPLFPAKTGDTLGDEGASMCLGSMKNQCGQQLESQLLRNLEFCLRACVCVCVLCFCSLFCLMHFPQYCILRRECFEMCSFHLGSLSENIYDFFILLNHAFTEACCWLIYKK